jgi:hypothetical protein
VTVGVFAAYSRRITSTKVIRVSLRIEALVPLVEGVPKMVMPPMCSQMIKSTVSRENRRGNGGGKDYHSTECFHVGHWVSPFRDNG